MYLAVDCCNLNMCIMRICREGLLPCLIRASVIIQVVQGVLRRLFVRFINNGLIRINP